MMDQLEVDHDCKLIQAIRELPSTETINLCREWENTPPKQRAARLQRLHRDAHVINSLTLPGHDGWFMPDCNQGQVTNQQQSVDPTDDSSGEDSSGE
ncbi:uncharacterized protein Triagg1_463 [Trichoderma aggressivum f. europaeum]|uniref:Uncharacterized protein n=1 Tax=Trichoderma aggressivum f. europaeum TaxID=173218 RepID=A0AAE1ILE2_9HYPO|nr:hypothetical protein Triagg1_463 [Trichoderma aggressivum f. europaeum]